MTALKSVEALIEHAVALLRKYAKQHHLVKEFLRIYDLDQQDRLGDVFDHRIYYVMRTHSGHASRVMTWRVMSRPIQGRHHALNWMDFEKSQEKNKRHKFFLVQVATMVPEMEEG